MKAHDPKPRPSPPDRRGANGAPAGGARAWSFRGIGGWLLFYLIWQALGLLLEAVNFPFWNPDQHARAAFVRGVLVPAMLLSWVIMAISLALILVRRKTAVQSNIAALGMKIVVVFLNLYAMWGELGGAGFYLGLPVLCFPILASIAWIAYFLRSRRVAETLDR